MISDQNASEDSFIQSLMDDEPKNIIAKTFECPEKLDLSDYVVLDSYSYTGMNLVYRNYELAQGGFFEEHDWKAEVDNYAHWYLSGELGRAYWDKVGRNYFDPEFTAYVDSVLAKPGMELRSAWYEISSSIVQAAKMSQEISVQAASSRLRAGFSRSVSTPDKAMESDT